MPTFNVTVAFAHLHISKQILQKYLYVYCMYTIAIVVIGRLKILNCAKHDKLHYRIHHTYIFIILEFNNLNFLCTRKIVKYWCIYLLWVQMIKMCIFTLGSHDNICQSTGILERLNRDVRSIDHRL